jgi:glutamine synthetase
MVSVQPSSFHVIRPQNPDQVVELIKQNNVEIVDLRFTDLPGLWQHFSITLPEVNPGLFSDGIGFDGSSIRGFQEIHESDMLLKPDPATAFIDPESEVPTLAIICDVFDPVLGQAYSRDPRFVARKAESYLNQSGVATTCYFGPELEFFIFDNAWYDQGINYAKYYIGSREGIWGRGDEDPMNLGYKIRLKEGYFPTPPMDTMQNIRSEMVATLIELGIPVEAHHHEVATGGQCEIDMRFQDLVTMADNVMMYKYVCKNVAARHGKVVTFMPKPLFQDNGSGMHVHFSLWKGEKPLFAGNRYAGLSETGLYAIGGILKHAAALCALCNPTTNSYKRLVPGYEAPVNLVYSSRNRSAAVRIPMYSENPKTKRIEFRCPDSSCNPYLAFSGMVMAAIDGIENKIHPGEPMDKDIYHLKADEYEKIDSAPGSLEEALNELENDHEFLLNGDVFTADVIHYWIKYKRENEVDAIRMRPHPYEFCMYFDI